VRYYAFTILQYRATMLPANRYLASVVSNHQCRMLALISQKGGSGKTTLALHLAVIAQEAGLRTLLVDCDPQRSVAGWWRARAAAAPELVETTPDQLRTVLEAAQADGVALIVVDTRPSVERDTAEVARVADFSLIPTRPSILDLRAIGATVDVIKALNRPAAIILNACPAPRGAGEASVTVEARRGLLAYGLPIASQAVTVRAALAHALIDGRAVTEFEPDGKAAGELRRVWKWTEHLLWPNAQA
jgi:chromosome partitioning protein